MDMHATQKYLTNQITHPPKKAPRMTQEKSLNTNEDVETFLLENQDWEIKEDNKLETIFFEGSLKASCTSYPDGCDIHYKQYKQKKPRGLVVIFHGLGNCSALQTQVANPLAENNYEVVAFDQIGHGKSFLGGTCEFYNYKDLYELSWSFLDEFIKTNEILNGLPIFLYGQSMGGGTILEMLLHPPLGLKHKITGVAICAPAVISPKKPGPILFGVLNILSSIYGSYCLPGDRDLSGMTTIKFEKDRRSKHPDVWPPSNGLPICTAREMLNLMDDIQANIEKLDIPMLLQHGEKDLTCLMKGSELVHEKNQNKDKTFIRFENGLHGLANDVTALVGL
jgi:acylglycerol lipase